EAAGAVNGPRVPPDERIDAEPFARRDDHDLCSSSADSFPVGYFGIEGQVDGGRGPTPAGTVRAWVQPDAPLLDRRLGLPGRQDHAVTSSGRLRICARRTQIL